MKNNFLSPLIFLGLLALGASLWTGCASKSVNESDPKAMYEDADQDINNDRYLLALDKLRIVKSKFSYTSYGALAQLRIGDVYFLQDSFPEAASAYETFVELYPKHEKASYATFRAGESYFNDIPSTIARDLRTAESAIQTFTTYLKKYPNGEFSIKSREMKSKAYNKLAEKEFEIAQFYIHRKKFDSAKVRLRKIIDQYSESDILGKARDLLGTLNSVE
jgi:outer membrane protein assembly factor BamD